MHWAENYIGQPYAEANCAELAAQVQREVFNRDVKLPGALAIGLRAQSKQIDDLQCVVASPVDKPVEGDAVLMKARGCLGHVGVFCRINNQDWVLHAMKNAGHAVLHRMTDLQNIGLSVEGYYRWN